MRRRTFLAAGVAGSALLAVAGWWRLSRHTRPLTLNADADAIVRAIVPAMLAGALPVESNARARAIDETVTNIARAIAGLPGASRAELAQLFSLLTLAPARRAFAGVASAWNEADVAEVGAFLDRWRDSGWALKRSAYTALHQLILAAWYGNPRAWTTIGYPGPPKVNA